MYLLIHIFVILMATSNNHITPVNTLLYNKEHTCSFQYEGLMGKSLNWRFAKSNSLVDSPILSLLCLKHEQN